MFIFTIIADKYCEEALADSVSLRSAGLNSLSNSTIPSVKFHLNLILESSRNANSSLVQCLTVISHQNEVGLQCRLCINLNISLIIVTVVLLNTQRHGRLSFDRSKIKFAFWKKRFKFLLVSIMIWKGPSSATRLV